MTSTRAARLVAFVLAILALLIAKTANAQLAPTGGHYADRGSDTSGAVNSLGGYSVSVPLDLPEARGGLPVPLAVVYGTRGFGAAGVGWDVPLSYVRRDRTFAHRRPAHPFSSEPQPREQVTLSLAGQAFEFI